MADNPAPTTSSTTLPNGTWRVDPTAGAVSFKARGMFGLASVNGNFGSYDGELTITPDTAEGELRIEAATLDTKNSRRDTHLRSAAFFDVENHPTVSFTLTRLTSDTADRLTGTGVLQIRENRLPLTAPLTISHHDDQLQLEASVTVDRAAAGVGWSKLGMIKGPAHLHASIVLVRQD
jgi:polyisoprenoid-binding protein YceI